jgi:hypothetical protein
MEFLCLWRPQYHSLRTPVIFYFSVQIAFATKNGIRWGILEYTHFQVTNSKAQLIISSLCINEPDDRST